MSLKSPASPSTDHAPRLAGLNADPAFHAIAAPELQHRVRLSHAVEQIKMFSQRHIGLPLGAIALAIWRHRYPGADRVERFGLPCHTIRDTLGTSALTVEVDPRQLVQVAELPRRSSKEHPSTLAFIWDGDWDLRRTDLRGAFWIDYMRDLDQNRDHLERTYMFQKHMAALQAGKPKRLHREGVLLNTPERIIEYLKVYLGFLDTMATEGYQNDRPNTGIGVLVTREGRLLKTRQGMHRTAMAQWVGLPRIPVEVRHIHRTWWNKVTAGTTGQEALDRMVQALSECTPEMHPGPADPEPPFIMPDDFWPAPKKTVHRPD